MPWRIALALTLTTIVTLGIELNFTRLVSLLFLASDAYWVIAVALLGFGSGGAAVAVAGKRLAARADWLLPGLMAAIGLTALIQLHLFRQLRPDVTTGFFPSNLPLAITLVSVVALPTFFLASVFISLVFMRYREVIGQLYFFDLLGAGLGCVIFLVLLRLVGVENSMVMLAGVAIAAALLLFPRLSWRAGILWAGAIVVLAATAYLIRGPSSLVPFVGRELRMLYEYQSDRAELEFQQWDPAARIDITSVPGHVLALPDRAEYKLLTQDGGAPSILLGFDRPFEQLEFPERSLLGAAYWVRRAESVLIIGPGGGPDVVAALRYRPSKVTAVELNGTTISVVRDHFRQFTGELYQQPQVEVVHDDGRHFVRTSDQRYDVIQLTGVDTTVLSSGGNLSENYLYTLEAFEDYWNHLTPDGMLSLTYPNVLGWGTRALGMLMKTMHEQGTSNPERHLLISVSGGYVSLLLKRSAFSEEEVEAVSQHFERPLVGLLLPLYYELWGQYLPQGSIDMYTNREFFDLQGILYDPFHSRSSLYGDTVSSWLDGPDTPAFWEGLDYVRPASDDRPFFFTPIDVGLHFSRRILWLAIPTLAFIIAPLAIFERRGMKISGAAPLVVYFACLGLAFISMEMIFLQKFVLFLGHPALSFAVTLGVLLIATGLGSLLSKRFEKEPLRGILVAVGGLTVAALLFVLLSGPLTEALLRTPLSARMLLVAAVVTPFGLLMGMLFPSGIQLLRSRDEVFVPWAWGINGSASVMGTLLSLFLAIKVGFSLLLLLSVGVYLCAAAAAVRAARGSGAR